MRKITSLLMMLLAFFVNGTLKAQRPPVTEETEFEIIVNKNAGNYKKANGQVTNAQGQNVALWECSSLPGLSFAHSLGKRDNMQVLPSGGIRPYRTLDNNSFWGFYLTEHARLEYSLVGYKIHSTNGEAVTLNAPTAVAHKFSPTTPDVEVRYNGQEPTEMTFRNSTQGGTLYSDDAVITVILKQHPVKDVVLAVKAAEDNSTLLTQTVRYRLGATINMENLPQALTRPLTTLSMDAPVVVSAAIDTVVVKATFSAPFDKASQAAHKKFLIRSFDNYYINHQEGDAYRLQQAKDFPTTYQWEFSGNPYTNVSIKNVATGLYLTTISMNVVKATSTTEVKWGVDFNKSVNVEASVKRDSIFFPLMNLNNNQRYSLNVQGGTHRLVTWGNVSNASIFAVEELPDIDYKPYVKNDFETLRNSQETGVFFLKSEKKSEFDRLYDEAMAAEKVKLVQYDTLTSLVANLANYQLPTAGYYYLHAQKENTYVGALNDKSEILSKLTKEQAQKDPSSIVEVKTLANGKFQLLFAGTPISAQRGQKIVLNATATPAEVIISYEGKPGYGRIQLSDAANTVLQAEFGGNANQGQIGTWTKEENNRGYWAFEPATTVQLPLHTLNGQSYATAYLPYDVTIEGTGVKAYGVKKDGTTTEISEGIAKGTGVVLVSETGDNTVLLNIVSGKERTSASDLEGSYLPKTVDASSTVVLSTSANDPNSVGFYRNDEAKVGAFKAYFTIANLNAPGVNGFKLQLGGITTNIDAIKATSSNEEKVYDLLGRPAKATTKGVFISNGKKMIK